MTIMQKIIKYLAIAFAIFLIVTIISTILAVVFSISAILGLKSNIESEMKTEYINTINFENNNINKLDIDIAHANLTIKTGKNIRLETNCTSVKYKEEDSNLKIEEKNNIWFKKQNQINLILYIPEETELKDANLIAGTGKIIIENLNTKKLKLKLGAGKTQIHKITVTEGCEIDSGAGETDILSGSIKNLDLDMGIGNLKLTSYLIESNEIDAGIGNLQINLQGEKNLYKVKVDKGLGNITSEEKEIINEEIIGNGNNYVEINGGIGNIDINFNK